MLDQPDSRFAVFPVFRKISLATFCTASGDSDGSITSIAAMSLLFFMALSTVAFCSGVFVQSRTSARRHDNNVKTPVYFEDFRNVSFSFFFKGSIIVPLMQSYKTKFLLDF
jgi:hypothetical protein